MILFNLSCCISGVNLARMVASFNNWYATKAVLSVVASVLPADDFLPLYISKMLCVPQKSSIMKSYLDRFSIMNWSCKWVYVSGYICQSFKCWIWHFVEMYLKLRKNLITLLCCNCFLRPPHQFWSRLCGLSIHDARQASRNKNDIKKEKPYFGPHLWLFCIKMLLLLKI